VLELILLILINDPFRA